MTNITRRRLLQTTAGMGALAAMGVPFQRPAYGAEMMFKPEDGAELTLMRWKRFVQSEQDAFT